MAETLKEKTAKGIFWGGLNTGIQQLLNLFFGIFLARLLSPGDYGLMGMLAIFTGIAILIQDSGFTAALINKKDIKHEDYNSVFWFSVTAGMSLYIILFFCAPYIADFFHQPELKALSRFMFLWIVFSCTSTVHNAILLKHLMQKEKAKIEITALIISCTVGVTMAWHGMAYWSLAVQTVVHGFVGVVLKWCYSPWRPTFNFDVKPLKEMFPFSVKILLTGVFTTVNNNIFSVLLGRFYNKQEVGYYTQGNKWMYLGYIFIWNMLNGVSQPVLTQVTDDAERQRNVFRKLLRFVSFISFPCMLGLALVARELIVITVSDKWLPSVYILQILCIWGAVTPLCNLYSSMIISRGRSTVYMYSTIALGIIQLVIICSTISLGIHSMLIAFVFVNISWLLVWHYFAWKCIGLRLRDVLFKDILPYFSITIIVLAAAFLVTYPIDNIYIKFIAKILTAMCLYIIIMYYSKSIIFRESITFLLKYLHKERQK